MEITARAIARSYCVTSVARLFTHLDCTLRGRGSENCEALEKNPETIGMQVVHISVLYGFGCLDRIRSPERKNTWTHWVEHVQESCIRICGSHGSLGLLQHLATVES